MPPICAVRMSPNGVPMPLLSYGGTVMLTVMIGFGLVLAVRVQRYSEVTSGRGALL